MRHFSWETGLNWQIECTVGDRQVPFTQVCVFHLSFDTTGQLSTSILGLKTSTFFSNVSLPNMQSHTTCRDREELLPHHLSGLSVCSGWWYMLCYMSERKNIPVLTQMYMYLIKYSTYCNSAWQNNGSTTQHSKMSWVTAGEGQLSAYCQACQGGPTTLFSEMCPEEFWHFTKSKAPTTFERQISGIRSMLSNVLSVS